MGWIDQKGRQKLKKIIDIYGDAECSKALAENDIRVSHIHVIEILVIDRLCN